WACVRPWAAREGLPAKSSLATRKGEKRRCRDGGQAGKTTRRLRRYRKKKGRSRRDRPSEPCSQGLEAGGSPGRDKTAKHWRERAHRGEPDTPPAGLERLLYTTARQAPVPTPSERSGYKHFQ